MRRSTSALAVIALALAGLGIAAPASATSVADMSLTVHITTNPTTVNMPLAGTVTNMSINWGDGTTSVDNGPFSTAGLKSHTYTALGDHTVHIYGDLLTGFGSDTTVCGLGDYIGADTITAVASFASTLTSLDSAFYGAMNLVSVPTSLPVGVSDLACTFADASKFNQNISGWITNNVTNMAGMFESDNHLTIFNQPIGNWDTGNVTDMAWMLSDPAFNQPIGSWNTGNVTSMLGMFAIASTFNQPIGSWNTSHVTSMWLMFTRATSFNQPLLGWNTIRVTNMAGLFDGAAAFDQDLSGFAVGRVTTMAGMLNNSGLSSDHYDLALNGWAAQRLLPSVPLGAAGLTYSSTGLTDRNLLTGAPNTWSITGDALAADAGITSASLAGMVKVGATLTSAPIGLAGRPTVTYQWASSADGSTWNPIAYATSSTYSVLQADFGNLLQVTITAGNGNAAGSVSASAVTATRVIEAPSAPRAVTASARSGAAVVSWLASAADGGSAISGYTVTAAPGGRTCHTTGVRLCTVTGLVNAHLYTFTVKATNAAGTSSVSAKSAAIIAGTASSPRSLAITFPATHQAKVTWSAPASLGSGAVTSYQVRWSSNSGVAWSAWVSTRLIRSATRSALTKRHGYQVQVRAINHSGAGVLTTKFFTQTK